jgi:hypothetical protein
MNAYKLADQLDNVKYQNGAKPFEMYANMLRQQADRIAELEKCLFQMQNACIDLTEQSAEPVAWIDPKELDMDVSTTVTKNKQFDTDIPLYTTPQTKPLSDEEIEYYEHLIAKLFNVSIQQKVIGLDRIIRAIEERHGIK